MIVGRWLRFGLILAGMLGGGGIDTVEADEADRVKGDRRDVHSFGNPHEMPLPGLVNAIRERAQPQNKNWFAYKTSEVEAQTFLAERLSRELGLSFDATDIALTTGAFAAIMLAIHLLLDVGDEAVFSEPAWFCYEPMLLAAAAVINPAPQLPLKPLGVATTRPAGNVSVKPTPESGSVVLLF